MILENGVSSLGLRIKDIKADGNCLFRAIGHQITLNKSAFENKSYLAEEFLSESNNRHKYLRQQAAQYVLKHENTFAPFLALEDNPEPPLIFIVNSLMSNGILSIEKIKIFCVPLLRSP